MTILLVILWIPLIVAQSTFISRSSVLPTARLNLKISVTDLGLKARSDVFTSDDMVIGFRNLKLRIPVKTSIMDLVRATVSSTTPSLEAFHDPYVFAPQKCSQTQWSTTGRTKLTTELVLVEDFASLFQYTGQADLIPYASWQKPWISLDVEAFERDGSRSDCTWESGDNFRIQRSDMHELCFTEGSNCVAWIGAGDGWVTLGNFEYKVAAQWDWSGTRRSLVLNSTNFIDVPPVSSSSAAFPVTVTRTSSPPYEFASVSASAGAGFRFEMDSNGNLARHLYTNQLTISSIGTVVRIVFASPFVASNNADRRIGSSDTYNISITPIMRARFATTSQVRISDTEQPILEISGQSSGVGPQYSLLDYKFSFVLGTNDDVNLWFTIGTGTPPPTTAAATTTTSTTSTTRTTTAAPTTAVVVTPMPPPGVTPVPPTPRPPTPMPSTPAPATPATTATTQPPPPDCPLQCSGHGTCLETNMCACVDGWLTDGLLGCREPPRVTVAMTGTTPPDVTVKNIDVSIATETRAIVTPEPQRPPIETTSTAPPATPSTTPSIEMLINNNLYYIIGGAVGGVIFFAVCIGLIICCLARKRSSGRGAELEYGSSSIMMSQSTPQGTGLVRPGYAGGGAAYSTEMSAARSSDMTRTSSNYPNVHMGGTQNLAGSQSYAGAGASNPYNVDSPAY